MRLLHTLSCPVRMRRIGIILCTGPRIASSTERFCEAFCVFELSLGRRGYNDGSNLIKRITLVARDCEDADLSGVDGLGALAQGKVNGVKDVRRVVVKAAGTGEVTGTTVVSKNLITPLCALHLALRMDGTQTPSGFSRRAWWRLLHLELDDLADGDVDGTVVGGRDECPVVSGR